MEGSGCGAVGKAVAYNSWDTRFESSHRQIYYQLYKINCVEKLKIRRGRGMDQYFKKCNLYSYWIWFMREWFHHREDKVTNGSSLDRKKRFQNIWSRFKRCLGNAPSPFGKTLEKKRRKGEKNLRSRTSLVDPRPLFRSFKIFYRIKTVDFGGIWARTWRQACWPLDLHNGPAEWFLMFESVTINYIPTAMR